MIITCRYNIFVVFCVFLQTFISVLYTSLHLFNLLTSVQFFINYKYIVKKKNKGSQGKCAMILNTS